MVVVEFTNFRIDDEADDRALDLGLRFCKEARLFYKAWRVER